MANKAPGKAHRKGISLIEIAAMFPTDGAAERWIEAQRWPKGPYCPYCGSLNVQVDIKHSSMTHRCRDCPTRPMFSLKTGTAMHRTQLGYREWAIAIYLLATNLKGVSSMKLHRDLNITQKSAWYLAHRLREGWKAGNGGMFSGPAEADETYLGGKRANMPKSKRKALKGRGAIGKTAVVGVKDRITKRVHAQVTPFTDAATLQSFIHNHVMRGAEVYTDEHGGYRNLKGFEHASVNHSVGEYVRGMAHTNGIESFWSMLKRAHKGTFHKLSAKHLNRYVTEFAGHHNDREYDTLAIMERIASGLSGKRLGCESRMAVMSAAWFVEFRQRLPWLLHVD